MYILYVLFGSYSCYSDRFFFSCILVLSLLTAAGSATCGSSHVNTMFGWKTPLSVGIEALDVVQ